MNLFWNLFALLVLAAALWFGKGAVKSVGVYHFSRGVARNSDVHVCDDPKCPATVLISAIDDTHRKVRTEAILAVVESLVLLAAAAYTFVFFMGRLA